MAIFIWSGCDKGEWKRQKNLVETAQGGGIDPQGGGIDPQGGGINPDPYLAGKKVWFFLSRQMS